MGHHLHSYLPSGESPWPDAEFTSQDVKVTNGQLIRLEFAERALPLAEGASFRELRCRMADNRQIVVIRSNPGLDLKVLAGSILAEFNADCFLDYLGRHSALDGLCEGIVDPAEEMAKAGSNAVTPGSFRPFGAHHAVREFVNAIKLVSFRAENMLAQIIRERVSQPDKATLILQDLLSSPADLVPDLRRYAGGTFTGVARVTTTFEFSAPCCCAILLASVLLTGIDQACETVTAHFSPVIAAIRVAAQR